MKTTNFSNESDPVYGSQVKRPLRVRALQIASLVLAVGGLILLYLYSVNRDIPTVRVSEITPTMNFATVKISGKVTRDAYIFKSGGVIFNLHDGSGEVAVMGGRAQTEALETAGKLPRRGDRVEVAGSLSVSADREVKLRMQSAEQLTL
ncbi:MAG: OB-fold nucleic acid binding domain-containing protein, partial [Victivallales bacterium]|nr:OB-fold nucleic acid binding domain-containing protein [Victivallales bacterium]